MYKKGFKRSALVKRRRYARKGKPTVSLAVKRYVKKTFHTNTENKINDYISLNESIASLSGFRLNLIPVLAQGVQSSSRLGNEIRIVKGFVKGFVNLLPYNAVTNPVPIQKVRIMCLSMKFINSTTLDTGTIWNYNNTSIALQSNLGDCLYSVNKDRYTCYYDKTFTLASPSQSTYTNGVNAHFSNDKFSIPFYIEWGKHCKQKLKYDDTTNTATNRNMFLFIQSVNADGTSSAVQPAEAHVFYSAHYEDA